ncbi:MAG TPA: hypothetical protein VFJ14_04880, partial [Nocardioidaceae bacterium]|nr:hypothetical protein [Nocardioidaceae bacterium]
VFVFRDPLGRTIPNPDTALTATTAQLPLDPWPDATAWDWDNPNRPQRPIPDLLKPLNRRGEAPASHRPHTDSDPDPPPQPE